VQKGPTGALVIETARGIEPNDDDLELLALFSSQAASAVRTTHELERLRSGALAALGRMATEVAHELKNPLAGLRLYARHLEHRLSKTGDGEGATLAQKITSTVDHLAAVVQEITAFGRPPELHRVPTALHGLLDECVAFAQAKCETPGIEVFRSYDDACPDAMLDTRELRKALLNLVINGLEALREGGRLTISTTYATDIRTVTIVIEDTGHGMSEETLSRIFDLFFTTKPQGTGLGMALARSVIDLHGGELTMHSALGKGTRVTIRLPLEPIPEGGGGA
jgi:signal transduction histidine kinase